MLITYATAKPSRQFALSLLVMSMFSTAPTFAVNVAPPCESGLNSRVVALVEKGIAEKNLTLTDLQAMLASAQPLSPFTTRALQPKDLALSNALSRILKESRADWPRIQRELSDVQRRLGANAGVAIEAKAQTHAFLRAKEIVTNGDPAGHNYGFQRHWFAGNSTAPILVSLREEIVHASLQIRNLSNDQSFAVLVNAQAGFASRDEAFYIAIRDERSYSKFKVKLYRVDKFAEPELVSEFEIPGGAPVEISEISLIPAPHGQWLMGFLENGNFRLFGFDTTAQQVHAVAVPELAPDRVVAEVIVHAAGDGSIFLEYIFWSKGVQDSATFILPKRTGPAHVNSIWAGHQANAVMKPLNAEQILVAGLLGDDSAFALQRSSANHKETLWTASNENKIERATWLTTKSGRSILAGISGKDKHLVIVDPLALEGERESAKISFSSRPLGLPCLLNFPDGREVLALALHTVGVQLIDMRDFSKILIVPAEVSPTVQIVCSKDVHGHPRLATGTNSHLSVFDLWGPE